MTRSKSSARTAKRHEQDHFLTPQRRSPFHDRISALMTGNSWSDWAGYDAAKVVNDRELEYFAIRSTAGLFDLSPMVKYHIEGAEAEGFLDRLTLRDVTRLAPGRVQYTAWCDDQGMVLDDGTLFRFGQTKFHLYCQEFHLPWLIDSAFGFDVKIQDITDTRAGLALQGPTSAAILRDAGFDAVKSLKPFDMAEYPLDGGTVTVSRTGFTGDLGYELFVDNIHALSLWDRLWQAGQPRGIRAIGSSALDMARIEAGFIVANGDFATADLALRANRMRRPDEIGLGWMANFDKPHFNGKRALLRARDLNENKYVLVGLEIEGSEPATSALIYHRKSREVGLVTAAIWSPTAKKNIAIASLKRPFGVDRSDDLWVQIYAERELQYHKMMKRARVVERPFIKLARRTMTPPADF